MPSYVYRDIRPMSSSEASVGCPTFQSVSHERLVATSKSSPLKPVTLLFAATFPVFTRLTRRSTQAMLIFDPF